MIIDHNWWLFVGGKVRAGDTAGSVTMTITAMIYPLIIGPYPFNNSFIHRFTLFIFSFFSLSSPPPSSLYLPLSLSTSLFSSVLSRPSSCSSLFLSSPLSPSLPPSIFFLSFRSMRGSNSSVWTSDPPSLSLSPAPPSPPSPLFSLYHALLTSIC